MSAPNYSVLQIRPAKDSLAGQTAFVEFLSSLRSSLKDGFWERLLGTFETICLEIVNLNQTTFFIISCPERLEHLIKSQIAAQYPTALITPMKDYIPDWINHGEPACGQLALAGPSHLSINSTLDDKVDQIAAILGGLSRVPAEQAVIIQLCLFAAPKSWQKNIRSIMEKGIPSKDPLKPPSPHPQKAIIEKKLAYQAFSCDIRIAAITANQKTSSQLLSQIAAAFGTYGLSEGNSLSLKVPKNPTSVGKLKQMITDRSAKYSDQFQFLNYGEIASLFHLPNANLAAIKGIAWGKSLKGEAPINLPVDEGIPEEDSKLYNFFAKTEYKNHMATFGMKKGIDRLRHTYILGKSGTGKSTLIGRMAINDIQHGEGVAFVDPHGDAAEILLDYVPEDRIDDVAYLDPSVPGISFWMNPLYVKNPAQGEMVASSIVSIFSKLYGNSWGPRLEYILRNTLLTLVYKPETTLSDVPRILTNKDFREKECLVHVTDPILVNFWRDEYDKYSEKFQTEAIAPILNKIGQFVTSPTIRDIINHPKSTVDFEDMMNSGKIVILNLPQGKIGEDNAALLGAMFISQIQIAAMNRANMAESDRKDFFLYVDEFQNFATSSFVKILSEARKYRLGLILANQYIAQLPEEIQNAIFGNVGTVMSYVVGASDADRIMKELNNLYTADDLVGLGKYQLAMKMSIESQMSQPFSSYGLPLPDTKTHQKEKVLKATYEKYYRKIEPMDMSQVTAVMTPAAKRYTEAPYVPKALRGTENTPSKNDYRPQQNDQNGTRPAYQPKAPYVPQLGPQYQGKPPATPRTNTQPTQTLNTSANQIPNQPTTPEKVEKTYFVPIPVPEKYAEKPQNLPTPQGSVRPADGTIQNPSLPMSIPEPTKEELDALRKEGLRPSVVGCFINNKKLLMVYQKTFNLWQIPQGGIENGEDISSAFDRELSEEITEDFVKTHKDLKIIGVDKIEFPPSKQGLRDMKTDSGEEVVMKGKYYYLVVTQTDETKITTDATEFSDYKWLNFEESYKLIKETNTGGKLRIYTQLLHLLKAERYLESTSPQNNEPNRPVQQNTARAITSYSSQPRTDNRSPRRPYSSASRPNNYNNQTRSVGSDNTRNTSSTSNSRDSSNAGSTGS